MNKQGLSYKLRIKILFTIIAGSILTTGTILEVVLAIIALSLLLIGQPLSFGLMGALYLIGIIVWGIGSLIIIKWLDTGDFIAGVVAIGMTGLTFLGNEVYYLTIIQPLVFATLMIGTFIRFSMKFLGIYEEETQSNEVEKDES